MPALVRGRNAVGKEFEEQTEISALSANAANFFLDSRVLIGAKIWLTVAVPRTAFLKIPLRLSLVGSTILVQAQRGGPKRQLVSIRLDKHFRLGNQNP